MIVQNQKKNSLENKVIQEDIELMEKETHRKYKYAKIKETL